jgi:hypothetical protein
MVGRRSAEVDSPRFFADLNPLQSVAKKSGSPPRDDNPQTNHPENQTARGGPVRALHQKKMASQFAL